MRVNAVIQARAGSSRLPGKVLEPLGSLTVLEWVIRAARAARLVDTVVVATTVEAADDAVARAAEAAGALVVRGSEDDVLSRYLLAVEEHPCDAVVRLTSDCPMLDPEVIDLVVSTWLGAPDLDYVSSVLVRTLPHGMDVELATTDALHRADAVATAHHRIHVTSAIYTDPESFDVVGLVFAPSAADLRITLDTPEDLEALHALVAVRGDGIAHRAEILRVMGAHPHIAQLNAQVVQKPLEAG
jgi:spore coat polysaccharide biosynthesis protein SpsF